MGIGGNATKKHLSSPTFVHHKLSFLQTLAQCWFTHYIELTNYLGVYQMGVYQGMSYPFLEHLSILVVSSRNFFSLSFSLSIFPRLNNLYISDFEGLEFLSISVSEGDPTSLNSLEIKECPDLEYIELPALESARYKISSCKKLKLLAHTHSSLQELRLIDCP